MKLTSAVIFTTDLGTSVAFYEKLLTARTTVRTSTAALLVGLNEDQLYLRAVSERDQHPLGGVGIQYLIWTASDRTELDRCEQLLREQSPRVSRRDIDGFTVLEGEGPDGLPVLVSHPGPDTHPRPEIIDRIYAW
jgi:catechol 2,3-dioxygenase-like lactoylglutathione lyase family enzyme